MPRHRSPHAQASLPPHPGIAPPTPRHRSPHTKTVRPLPDSALRAMGQHLGSYPWTEVLTVSDPITKFENFMDSLNSLINHHFPTKSVSLHPNDQPWMTPYVKELIHKRQQCFHSGNVYMFRHFRNKVIGEIKKSKKNWKTLKTDNCKISEWYRVIKQISGLNSKSELSFLSDTLPHVAANQINNFFASICQSLPELDPFSLPAFLPAAKPPPQVERREVYLRLSQIKTSKSTAPSDPPLRVMKEFAYELSLPLTSILNASFLTNIIPPAWKIGYITPLPKTKSPQSCNNLRPITITSLFAQIAEGFVADWLRNDTTPHLDPQQFGNKKSTSTTHYLLGLLDTLYKITDKPKSAAAVISIDFSKAFDRVDHTLAISHLLNNGARPEIVPWLSSFLSRRQQVVRYLGAVSDPLHITCGVPQGTKVGPIIFTNHIDSCLRQDTSQFKFVDDLTVVSDYSSSRPPLSQSQLDLVTTWANENSMMINSEKTKLMKIDFTSEKIVIPELIIQGEPIPTTDSMTLLGVIISSNLKWDLNTDLIISKACKRLGALRRASRFGMSVQQLMTFYKAFIRPTLEYGSDVWHSSLPRYLSDTIESTQKRFCRLALGYSNYTSYEDALHVLQLERLCERRESKFHRLAHRILQHPDHRRSLLPPSPPPCRYPLRRRLQLQPPSCRTARYSCSAIPSAVKFINNHS